MAGCTTLGLDWQVLKREGALLFRVALEANGVLVGARAKFPARE